MKPISFTILLLALLQFLIGCNVYREVEITRVKSVDFSSYRSYAWLPDMDGKGVISDFDNDFIRNQNRNYFGHCMKERDIELDTLNPDLLLQVEWLSQPREVYLPDPLVRPEFYDDIYYNAPSLYLYHGIPAIGDQWGNYQFQDRVEYAHGGAKLTVLDRHTNEIVWIGLAQGDLYDPKLLHRHLHPAIHKMMKRFPIKKTENKIERYLNTIEPNSLRSFHIAGLVRL